MSDDKKLTLATYTPEELSLTKPEHQILTADQLNYLFAATPKKHVYKRAAKGGGQWQYVTGVYVKKVLNMLFGWNWSFSVLEHKFDLEVKQAYVLGRLTVKANGQEIIKEQFGRVDIKFKRTPDEETGRRMPLDLGNDLKAAATDALKKCASELGIASDVYAPNEFKAIKVVESQSEDELFTQLQELFNKVTYDDIPAEEAINIERIIEEQEVSSYKKAINVILKYTK